MKKKIIIIILVIIGIVAVGYIVKKTNIFKGSEPVKTVEPMIRPISSRQNVLDLSGLRLTEVPGDTFEKTDTEELNLSNNNLSGALPSQVGKLQNLKVLNLSNNNFTGVPAEIGSLKNLELLDLSNNSITGLPNELGNLKNLKYLDLTGNNYSKADLNEIKRNLPLFTVVKVG